MEASASVVGILAHFGEVEIFRCSGFVIESKFYNEKFISSVMTTASLLRPRPDLNEVRSDTEISVTLANGIICKGVVVAFNFHYNIGILMVETDIPIEIANLKFIDDLIVFPIAFDETAPEYDNQSEKYNLVPGTTVVALGRDKGNELMFVAGAYCLANITLDCEELFRANIKISKYGIGGPVVNSHGEVIGVNFFHDLYTPFLPINIASMWWEQFKTKGMCLVPCLRMELDNLYMCGTIYLENVIQRFPGVLKGVVLGGEIASDSPAFGKIFLSDIIVKCDDKAVGSILELFELIWHKVGEPINLTVLRPKDGSHHCVSLTFDDVRPHQMYRWPLGSGRGKRMRCNKLRPWKWT